MQARWQGDDHPGCGLWYIEGNHIEGFPKITANNWDGGVYYEPGREGQGHDRAPGHRIRGPLTRAVPVPEGRDRVGRGGLRARPGPRRRLAPSPRSRSTSGSSRSVRSGRPTFKDGIIDDPADVGGWPRYEGGKSPADADRDGMPDTWELAHSLNPPIRVTPRRMATATATPPSRNISTGPTRRPSSTTRSPRTTAACSFQPAGRRPNDEPPRRPGRGDPGDARGRLIGRGGRPWPPRPSRSAPTASSIYRPDERGHRVLDFSTSGYRGGGVAIPDAPARLVVEPSAGDNTRAIQAAIDQVSAMPPDSSGPEGGRRPQGRPPRDLGPTPGRDVGRRHPRAGGWAGRNDCPRQGGRSPDPDQDLGTLGTSPRGEFGDRDRRRPRPHRLPDPPCRAGRRPSDRRRGGRRTSKHGGLDRIAGDGPVRSRRRGSMAEVAPWHARRPVRADNRRDRGDDDHARCTDDDLV